MTNGEANGGGNGAGVNGARTDQLILTLQRSPWRLEVGGYCESDDVALAMLQQAVRGYEARLRASSAIALAQQMEQARRDEQIRRSIGAGR